MENRLQLSIKMSVNETVIDLPTYTEALTPQETRRNPAPFWRNPSTAHQRNRNRRINRSTASHKQVIPTCTSIIRDDSHLLAFFIREDTCDVLHASSSTVKIYINRTTALILIVALTILLTHFLSKLLTAQNA